MYNSLHTYFEKRQDNACEKISNTDFKIEEMSHIQGRDKVELFILLILSVNMKSLRHKLKQINHKQEHSKIICFGVLLKCARAYIFWIQKFVYTGSVDS